MENGSLFKVKAHFKTKHAIHRQRLTSKMGLFLIENGILIYLAV